MIPDPSLAYRASAGENATPVRLVILLYEQLVKDLQKAASAMERNQIEVRTQEIDHALVVVGKLQSALDMDRGGQVAQNLDRFYDGLRGSLIEAQVRLSPEILRTQVGLLLTLREAWLEVEGARASNQAPAQRFLSPTSETENEPPSPRRLESLMRSDAVTALRQLNQRLRQRLLPFEEEPIAAISLSPQQITELFADLLEARACLHLAIDGGPVDAESSQEIAEFRRNFATLQRLLPTIQTVLLAERARLQGEHQHLQAATAWARAAKDSL